MKVRIVLGAAVLALLGALVTAVPANAEATVYADTIAQINIAHPSTSAQLHVGTGEYSGTYTVDWSIRRASTLPYTLPQITGTLNSDGTLQPIPIDGSNLPDDFYYLTFDVTLTDPVNGTITGQVNTGFESHQTFQVDSGYADATTIYPRVNTAQHKAYTVLRFTGPYFDYGTNVEIRNSSDQVVFLHETEYNEDRNRTHLSWSGTASNGTPLPAGVYSVTLVDKWDNRTDKSFLITISPLRLVSKTATAVFAAKQTYVDKFVGKCSTIKQPARKAWKGSHGLYANTKCSKQTWAASGVSVVYGVYLPSNAELYNDIQITSYSGAAAAKPRSYAFLEYLTKTSRWSNDVRLPKATGNHLGRKVSVTPYLQKDGSFIWRVATGYKNRYDVGKFKVVLHYKAVV